MSESRFPVRSMALRFPSILRFLKNLEHQIYWILKYFVIYQASLLIPFSSIHARTREQLFHLLKD